METRWAALAAALALGTALASTARAEFPEKPIEVLVPAGPGSATDTNTRLVVNKIAEQGTLPQPMVVVNVTGGGPLAANRTKDATPDGHTIMVYHVGLLGLHAVGKLLDEPWGQIGEQGNLRERVPSLLGHLDPTPSASGCAAYPERVRLSKGTRSCRRRPLGCDHAGSVATTTRSPASTGSNGSRIGRPAGSPTARSSSTRGTHRRACFWSRTAPFACPR